MIVLGIDTSCVAGSVALIKGREVLSETLFNSGAKHSINLISSIEYTIKSADIKKTEVEGISVSVGPGSYTSLRIGITTAKALAFSMNIPIVAVPTLEVIAHNLNFCRANICVAIDAKKNELFASLFKSDGDRMIRLTDDFVTTPENLCNRIVEKTLFIGDGINLYKYIFEYKLQGLALFGDEYLNIPRASLCALLGLDRFKSYDNKNNKVEISSISPLYLRKTDAELLI